MASRIGRAWKACEEAPGASVAVSVIVPAYNASRTLAASIASVRAAAPPDSEVIVVDDGSLDDTMALALQLADRVVQRPCRGGAARCRNDGVQSSRGRTLVFVDSDVTIGTGSITGALQALERGADAVFGAYQPLPPPEVRNVATTYKNLLHHYTHVAGAGEASTFWSGFGAVRRDAFLAALGFDCAVTASADVEDIHLGYRLRASGYRIVLDPTLQVAHHKQYTLRGLIASDVFHRAIPWTKAMLQLRTFSLDLNLRRSAIWSAVLAGAIPLCLFSSLLLGPWAAAVGGGLLGVWLFSNRSFLGYVYRAWSFRGALASAALLYLYFLYGVVGAAVGFISFLLRNGAGAMQNWMSLESAEEVGGNPLTVSVAVVVAAGERATALTGLPEASPNWELLVVAEDRPDGLPSFATFVPAPQGATREAMRDLALAVAKGEMFAVLDGHMIPDAGWLDRVEQSNRRHNVAVGGSFHDDQRGELARGHQLARFWEFRATRSATWVDHHPLTNAAVRTQVARQLGGFQGGALVPRLAGFGCFPVYFDPAMAVRLNGKLSLRTVTREVVLTAMSEAATRSRYRDVRVLTRLGLVALVPLAACASIAQKTGGPVHEGTADRSWLVGLPVTAFLVAAASAGKVLGLLRPAEQGRVVPRSPEDLPMAGVVARGG